MPEAKARSQQPIKCFDHPTQPLGREGLVDSRLFQQEISEVFSLYRLLHDKQLARGVEEDRVSISKKVTQHLLLFLIAQVKNPQYEGSTLRRYLEGYIEDTANMAQMNPSWVTRTVNQLRAPSAIAASLMDTGWIAIQNTNDQVEMGLTAHVGRLSKSFILSINNMRTPVGLKGLAVFPWYPGCGGSSTSNGFPTRGLYDDMRLFKDALSFTEQHTGPRLRK